MDVDGNATIIGDDLKFQNEGADSKISLCVRDIKNYFIYDPTTTELSSEPDNTDTTQSVDSTYGSDESSGAAAVVVMMGCLLPALLAVILH